MKKTIISGVLTLGLAVGFTGCTTGLVDLQPNPYNAKVETKSDLGLMEKQELLNKALADVHWMSNHDSYNLNKYGVKESDLKKYTVNKNCIDKYKVMKIDGQKIDDLYSNCFTINYNDVITRMDKSYAKTKKQSWKNEYTNEEAMQYSKYVNYIQDNLDKTYIDLLKKQEK